MRRISNEKGKENPKSPVQQESYHIFTDVLSGFEHIASGRAGHTYRG